MIRVFSAFFLFIPFLLEAQRGNTVYNFTKVPASVVAGALGGSQVGSAQNDITLTADNPAIADSSMHQSVHLGYLNYVTNINQATAFYARTIDSIGLASAYVRYFDYGSFTETDEFGNEVGSFRVSDYELGVSLSRPLLKFPRFRYGATLKQVYSVYYNNFSYGIGADIGAHYVSKSGDFTAGIVADNIGVSLVDYTRSGTKPMAFNLRVGLAKKLKQAPVRLGIQYNNLERWDLATADADARELVSTDPLTGDSTRRVFTFDNFLRHLTASVEILPSESFNLFVAYNFRRRSELAITDRAGIAGLSFGAMIKVKRIQIQYALASYTLGGVSHQFGVTTNLNEWYRKS